MTPIGPGEFPIGKMLMFFGGALLLAGAVWQWGGKWLPLGRLPGDIHVQRDNFSFSFPIVTCIVISVALTLVLNLFFRR